MLKERRLLSSRHLQQQDSNLTAAAYWAADLIDAHSKQVSKSLHSAH